ncbi:glycerate kinase [Enorma burkinafasonensis]|uniref:glycerate kinase n=1 Tax=Enorma burkinafasonensis TaxID=2590867 RepID=UPI0026ED7A3F|nr:glycerate kinase [Enorma burkinafasonensis]MCI7730111.1 glycerate kinase [Enorma burkinafasonensis]
MGSPRVVLAVDSFKGSATSAHVEELIEEGIRRVCADSQVDRYPIADGGEGTVEAIVTALKGRMVRATVQDPLGAKIEAGYGLTDDGTAIIEMAAASGITLIEQTPENALSASTWGVGDLIRDAMNHGARRILVGLGGSATSDGGVGMAKALGVRFLDAAGEPIPCGLIGLRDLARIDCSGLDPRIADTEFVLITDVTNPLCGASGALRIYGPQKGIDASKIAELDPWMESYAALLERSVGRAVADLPGAGAAGGLGAALAAFCDARIERGIEFVLDTIGLTDAIAGADLVITGEGRMDAQSANGKAPVGVARRAKEQGVPVVAIVGSRAEDLDGIYDEGIGLVVPLALEPMSLAECIARTEELVPIAGETAMRAYLLGRVP